MVSKDKKILNLRCDLGFMGVDACFLEHFVWSLEAQADPAASVTRKPHFKSFFEIKRLQLVFFC